MAAPQHRFRTARRLACIAAASMLAIGCVVTQELLVDSNPQGAEVYVNAEKVGVTPYVGPATFPQPEHRLVIQVVKPGCWPDRQVRHKTDSLNVFVNLQPLPDSQ